MGSAVLDSEELKAALKDALVEVLEEKRGLISEILEEVLEEIAFARAIGEGAQSPLVSRDEVFESLEPAN